MSEDATAKQLEDIHNEIARAYIQAMLQVLYLQKHGELNFVKKTIEMPNGSVYLLQVQHVTGPKLNVTDFIDGNESKVTSDEVKE